MPFNAKRDDVGHKIYTQSLRAIYQKALRVECG